MFMNNLKTDERQNLVEKLFTMNTLSSSGLCPPIYPGQNPFTLCVRNNIIFTIQVYFSFLQATADINPSSRFFFLTFSRVIMYSGHQTSITAVLAGVAGEKTDKEGRLSHQNKVTECSTSGNFPGCRSLGLLWVPKYNQKWYHENGHSQISTIL